MWVWRWLNGRAHTRYIGSAHFSRSRKWRVISYTLRSTNVYTCAHVHTHQSHTGTRGSDRVCNKVMLDDNPMWLNTCIHWIFQIDERAEFLCQLGGRALADEQRTHDVMMWARVQWNEYKFQNCILYSTEHCSPLSRVCELDQHIDCVKRSDFFVVFASKTSPRLSSNPVGDLV